MIGERLGQYEILEKLGQGGMGEVWKARDPALDREVAIKLLPELFSSDAERLARFEREAKLLASLNHPGIAAVHGLHEQDGRRFLAMELVPGVDLSRRLTEGPLGVDEALFVGAQVAEALEAAHAQGVIHRDLKPANIMITPEGRAKVLDFGLAKISESGGSGSASVSPTVTSGGTADGVILGTAAYMSPEQTRGRPLDRRTDVWSFGCVLFESLTGTGLFRGETISDSLGAILHKDPDWSLLPAQTPPTVRLLLRRCLTKNADKRLHDIADARIELQGAIEDPSSSAMGLAEAAIASASPKRGAGRWTALAAGSLALLLGLAGGWLLRGDPPALPVHKLDLGVALTSGAESPEVAISPDGTRVVFTNGEQLWMQSLDQLDPRLIEGTTGALAPFWSPDGTEIGYFLGGKLWRSPAGGGRGVAVCDLGGAIAGGRGASWGEDGRIVFSRGNSPVFSVPALGGEPEELIPLEEGEGDIHDPHVLPEGRGYLFVSHGEGAPGVLTLLRNGERRVLLDDRPGRIVSPSYAGTGHILFARVSGDVTEGLWALPFSLDRMEAGGEPFLVAAEAGGGNASRDGTLAFVHRPLITGQDEMVWKDRKGNAIEAIGPPRMRVGSPSLSPDGRWLAFTMVNEEDQSLDLWVRDLERGTETQLTLDPAFEFRPLWSPSGEEIYFTRFDPEGPMVTANAVPADGSARPRSLLERATTDDLTPDGRSLVISRFADGEAISPDGRRELWVLPLEEGAEPSLLLGGTEIQDSGVVSPDGRLMAYVSERSGQRRLFLTRFPEIKGRWQISTSEGSTPRWGPRGDRLYFRVDRDLMEVTVGTGDPPELGRPELLFELPEGNRRQDYAVAPDGERFITLRSVTEADDEISQSGIKIVQSWFTEFQD